jgi:acyl-CoA synthetase (AMP-forming)/AMP-acid ligase II
LFEEQKRYLLSPLCELSPLFPKKPNYFSSSSSYEDLLSPGDRVCLIYTPSLDFIKALMGCFYARIIAVPIAPHAILGGFARLGVSASGQGAAGGLGGIGEMMESMRTKGVGTSTMLSFLAKLLDNAQPNIIFCSEGGR